MNWKNTNINTGENYLKKYRHPGLSTFCQALLYFTGRYLLRLVYRVQVKSLENIPATGPLLYLAKHQRYSDVPLGFAFVNMPVRKDAWCVVMEKLARWFWFGYWLRAGGIPITREDPDKYKNELLLARKVLQDGNSMVMFPEQKLTPSKMGLGKITGFRMITENPETPIQVVPVAFKYINNGFLRRTTAAISTGPVSSFTGNDDPCLFLHNRMVEMAQLCGLEYDYKVYKN